MKDYSGVSPIGVVEPFNNWQMQGLSSLADFAPQTTPQGYMIGNKDLYQKALAASGSIPINQSFQRGQGFYDTATQQLDAGTAGITGNDIAAYMNPYTQQVTDRAVARINEQGANARARLNASQAGRRSFGDSSGAIQLSQLDNNLLGQVGDTSANLGYQGWQSALGQVNNDRNRNLSAAQIAGSLGGQTTQEGFQGMRSLEDLINTGVTANEGYWSNFKNLKGDALENINNKITAGATVQNQNQRLLDAVNGEYGRMQNYDSTQLSDLANFLQIFNNSANSTGQSGGNLNTLGKLGGVAMAASGTFGR